MPLYHNGLLDYINSTWRSNSCIVQLVKSGIVWMPVTQAVRFAKFKPGVQLLLLLLLHACKKRNHVPARIGAKTDGPVLR